MLRWIWSTRGMSVHLAVCIKVGLPPEQRLLNGVTVRLLADSERERFDELLAREHYLKNPMVVGRVLRYVAEYQGQWVALLVFNSAALHLKPRDRWLKWLARQVKERRHLIAQNSRFLVLAAAGKWPNLATRVLKLVGARLAQDWRERFGYAVLAVETFVDPQRFRGTCYQAAGWQLLGATQGFERTGKDFYTDTQHPKELWVRPLGDTALAQLQAAELAPALADPNGPLRPACTVASGQLDSLWECLHQRLTDPRDPRGVRYQLATFLCLVALAVAAGCQGPHAIAEFAQSLNHGQRRHLRCRPRKGAPREFDVPCERTFERLLPQVDADQLKQVLAAWMVHQRSGPVEVVPLDGKVVKNAQPAPARSQPVPAEPCEIPLELQKPKADKALILVNFHTFDQCLFDQVAVPQDTNEEAAVAAYFPHMDLAGICLTADAAHTIKANCRQLTQGNGADFVFSLKANQPTALAKAQQLLPGTLPPQVETLDKGHGRIETRRLWSQAIEPTTLGLAGAAQVMRVERDVQTVRGGQVIKQTHEVAFFLTSLWPQEAGPARLLALIREHWSIENGQFFRRDRTQDEDRCTVSDPTAARHLCVFRSLAIFLFKAQSERPQGKSSLPDFQRHVLRQPWGLIRRLTVSRQNP